MSLLISLPWHKTASVLWVTDSWTVVASPVYTFMLTHKRGREYLNTLFMLLFKIFSFVGCVCLCIQMYVGLEVCSLGYKCGCLSPSSHSIFVCLCLLSVHLFLFHWIWSVPFWVDLLARKFQGIHLLHLSLQCWGYKPNFNMGAGDPK